MLGQHVVVIAGHDHDRPAGESAAKQAKNRLGVGQHGGDRAVTQLERVAEQNETIDPLEGVDQGLHNTVAPQHIVARTIPDMQVGDDQRPHPTLPLGGARTDRLGQHEADVLPRDRQL